MADAEENLLNFRADARVVVRDSVRKHTQRALESSSEAKVAIMIELLFEMAARGEVLIAYADFARGRYAEPALILAAENFLTRERLGRIKVVTAELDPVPTFLETLRQIDPVRVEIYRLNRDDHYAETRTKDLFLVDGIHAWTKNQQFPEGEFRGCFGFADAYFADSVRGLFRALQSRSTRVQFQS